MEAGKLRHRITLQEPIRGESAQSGEVTLTSKDRRQVWAAIDTPTAKDAREVQQFGRADHVLTHMITIRYAPDMGADWRIEFKGRHFHVIGMQNVTERKIEFRISASEIA